MLFFEYWYLLNNFLYLNIGCKNGMYGRDCRYYCSGNCLYNVFCNLINGYCDSGCVFGYLDVFCNKGNILFIVSLLYFIIKWK